MSILSSRSTRVVTVPGDDASTATIRKLSGRQLQAARDAWGAAARQAYEAMGGAELQKGLASLGDPATVAARVAELQQDPCYGLDQAVLILRGVVALSDVPDFPTWTVDQKTAWYEDELGQEEAVLLAQAIVDLTLPARDEAGRKNGSGPSTSS